MAKKNNTIENFYNHTYGFKTNESVAKKSKKSKYEFDSLISPVYGEKDSANSNSNSVNNENNDLSYLNGQSKNTKYEQSLVSNIVNSVVNKEINSFKPQTKENKNSKVSEIKNSILLKQPSLPKKIFFPRSDKQENLPANYEQLKKELSEQKAKMFDKSKNNDKKQKKYQQIHLFEDKEK